MEENPLSFAVDFADPFMVEYLIAHGANCRKSLGAEEYHRLLVGICEEPEEGFDSEDPQNNDYLLSIDMNLHESGSRTYITDVQQYRRHLLRTAAIIAKAGKLWPFKGLDLRVTEREVISGADKMTL